MIILLLSWKLIFIWFISTNSSICIL